MKKKTIGRLAAVSLAAMTAVSSLAVTASAAATNKPFTESTTNPNYVSGDVYKVVVTDSYGVARTKYYTTAAAATAANPGLTVAPVPDNVQTALNSSTIYLLANGELVTTKPDTYVKQYYTGAPSSSGSTSTGSGAAYVKYRFQSSTKTVYYSGVTFRWYPNLASLYADGGQRVDKTQASNFDSTHCWFDTGSGVYEDHDDPGHVLITYESNENDYYYGNYYDGTWSTYDVYKVNGRYYPTLSEAESAARAGGYTISKIRDYSAPQTNYFSYTTGYYYSTYAAALSASGNNSNNVRTFSYYSGDYYDGYYYNGYYYNGGYLDPSSYYWWVMYGNGKKDDDSSNSNDTTTAAIGKRKGWTSVAKYLGNLKSGSSVKVSMNYETTIPSSVTSAIKGKNVTVQFVLKNGTVFTINGKDISSAKNVNINTAYNTNNVPSKLVKAAYKKNKAVSTAQISIDGDSFGAAADITVKFASKRAGYTAKLYRYNPSKKTLSPVDSAKIQDNGKCTFGEVTKGGDFVIVIC